MNKKLKVAFQKEYLRKMPSKHVVYLKYTQVLLLGHISIMLGKKENPF